MILSGFIMVCATMMVYASGPNQAPTTMIPPGFIMGFPQVALTRRHHHDPFRIHHGMRNHDGIRKWP